jgi:hypothetical protein
VCRIAGSIIPRSTDLIIINKIIAKANDEIVSIWVVNQVGRVTVNAIISIISPINFVRRANVKAPITAPEMEATPPRIAKITGKKDNVFEKL